MLVSLFVNEAIVTRRSYVQKADLKVILLSTSDSPLLFVVAMTTRSKYGQLRRPF